MPSGVYKRTEKHKKAISGENAPMFGKHHSKAAKEKMRKAKLGKNNSMFGKRHSKATKRKISLNHADFNGENHPNWKGGRKSSKGYILIWSKSHPNCDNCGYIQEHRLVMEKHLDRYLTKEEVVHHENEIKTDNNLKNLKLFKNNSEHKKHHNKLRKRNEKGMYIK